VDLKDLRTLDAFRDHAWERKIARGAPFDPRDAGAFQIPSPVDGQPLRCMVSAARNSPPGFPPWDHVSVSRADRAPNWQEMDAVYGLFFEADEVAVQFHVPTSDHVNHHPHCLHIWAWHGFEPMPTPPSIMVGPDSAKGRPSRLGAKAVAE
jgi:hypothetical protein